MSSGAWRPLHVGGAICLVNSDNERDLSIILDVIEDSFLNDFIFLDRRATSSSRKLKAITGL